MLPECFVWTRYGTEAGETINEILKRKEEERLTNHGVFFWGIGNALGPSLKLLLEVAPNPIVVFSPIKSRPRIQDRSPDAVITWKSGLTIEGIKYPIPNTARITSRAHAGKQTHYALICHSAEPLKIRETSELLKFDALQNLKSGSKIGGSQVTAVVRHNKTINQGLIYQIAFTANLSAPYFLTLTEY